MRIPRHNQNRREQAGPRTLQQARHILLPPTLADVPDPDLKFAPKILRKTYITLSQQQHQGRSEITSQMSRHASIDVLNKHYNKPSIETKKEYASKVSKVFKFIQRRSA